MYIMAAKNKYLRARRIPMKSYIRNIIKEELQSIIAEAKLPKRFTVKKLPKRAIQVRRISTPKIYHLGMKTNIMTIETGNVFPEEQAERYGSGFS